MKSFQAFVICSFCALFLASCSLERDAAQAGQSEAALQMEGASQAENALQTDNASQTKDASQTEEASLSATEPSDTPSAASSESELPAIPLTDYPFRYGMEGYSLTLVPSASNEAYLKSYSEYNAESYSELHSELYSELISQGGLQNQHMD